MGMGTGVGCGLVSVLGIGANWRLGSRWNEYLFVEVSTYGESIFTGVTSRQVCFITYNVPCHFLDLACAKHHVLQP